MSIERSAISVWSDYLGMKDLQFAVADEASWGEGALGQSVAVLRKS
jgi:hypothetical protein